MCRCELTGLLAFVLLATAVATAQEVAPTSAVSPAPAAPPPALSATGSPDPPRGDEVESVPPAAETAIPPTASAAAIEEGGPEVTETERAALNARLSRLADRLDAAAPGSAEADSIDVDLVAAVEAEQRALDVALDRLGFFGGAPETDPRWQQVHLHGEALLRLVELREASRQKASEARRRDTLTFGREGFRQLGREVRTIGLAARYLVAKRRHTVDEAPRLARDLFTVGAALTHFVLVVAVLVGAVWVRRRWRGWLEQLRRTVFRSFSSVASKRRSQRLMRAIEVIAPWSLFLLAITALRWALGPAARATEVEALLTLLTIFGLYRLAIEAVAAGLVGIAVHYGLDTSTNRRAMLLRSVRTVLRVGAALVLITLVSRGMGQGFLSSLILKLGWLIVLAAVLIELFRWRGVIIDTCLKLQPTGRLAATLRATRSHWYGALVAPAAFLWLVGRGVTTVAGEFALGFEQTQKAMAFLFRQKVQRQAEREGYAEGDVAELPAGVAEAFAECAVDRGPLVVTHFPGLDELHELISGWRDTGARGSFLLTGERGIGKTSWLNQVRREDIEIKRIVLGRRVTDVATLTRRLAELLELDLEADAGPRELAGALVNGPQRVVVLDMAQHLFLADVGGYDAFSAFAALVNRTCRKVFWLCSMSSYAWRHLRAVRPDATVFRVRHNLGGWSDERIGALISARCAASGVRFNFADLVVDRMEGVSVRSRLIESQEGYTRLLWDYSDGNPRAALHFFLRSLDPDRSGRVRVRLFKAPEVEVLEDGGEDGLFVLAAIVVHESISLDDLEEVTRFDRVQCFIHLDRLQEIGAIAFEDEMYRVSTTWHRAAVRLLRRRNLLPE
jgi:hypothetical protein